MTLPDGGGPSPTQPHAAASGESRFRVNPNQPLRAHWDPTLVDSGRARTDRAGDRKMQSAFGRFISTYGWRAYAIPVLIVVTAALLISSLNRPEAPVMKKGKTVTANPSAAIGAPHGNIDVAKLPFGVLPNGGPYTKEGKRVYRVLAGTSKKIGTGNRVYKYVVEVEEGIVPAEYGGDVVFGKMVELTLGNPKSWIGGGEVSFQRIDSGKPDLRISLSSTNTTAELCGYQIKLESSCYYPPDNRVTLNEARWVRGAISFEGDDLGYRQYLLNHEIGHGIGIPSHLPCPKNGELAPIMMQQSFGVSNKQVMQLDSDLKGDPQATCRANSWPYPNK